MVVNAGNHDYGPSSGIEHRVMASNKLRLLAIKGLNHDHAASKIIGSPFDSNPLTRKSKSLFEYFNTIKKLLVVEESLGANLV